ncbi:hypothetical protein [Roseomonas chloroacetimidivorans]|uniref:hypothetical protein n=1 Tax=Roseomonas chloroacetimidivorans TaxID=1766656 RepID=UPI003C725B75
MTIAYRADPAMQPAFAKLFALAGHRYDVLERALVACKAANGGKAPSYQSVVEYLTAKATGVEGKE